MILLNVILCKRLNINPYDNLPVRIKGFVIFPYRLQSLIYGWRNTDLMTGRNRITFDLLIFSLLSIKEND